MSLAVQCSAGQAASGSEGLPSPASEELHSLRGLTRLTYVLGMEMTFDVESRTR
jgi:hypothetical protein